jgi:hypothetical protein
MSDDINYHKSRYSVVLQGNNALLIFWLQLELVSTLECPL